MRETTIRRLLVLVLCASGIVALWILADRSLSTPDAAHSDPSETTSQSGSRAASPIGSDTTERGGPSPQRADPAPPAVTSRPTSHPGVAAGNRRQTQSRQDESADLRPPAVRGLHVVANNHDSITVRWNVVRYQTAIAYYHVTLNGIPVGDTAGLQLTINWFNDDMTSHFIRVRAVDVDGRLGEPGRPARRTLSRTVAPTDPNPQPNAQPDADPQPNAQPDPGSQPDADTATDGIRIAEPGRPDEPATRPHPDPPVAAAVRLRRRRRRRLIQRRHRRCHRRCHRRGHRREINRRIGPEYPESL